jgi:hypothetical protein
MIFVVVNFSNFNQVFIGEKYINPQVEIDTSSWHVFMENSMKLFYVVNVKVFLYNKLIKLEQFNLQ